ncbi:MAG: hypothetical protein FWF42_03755 [Streptococcaceae bacterium]|nr:hypothetical protein [Streptococcaceae bacterium]MCL2681495.1 hypothetical protein [Streptococcaceae bacterium]MCL2858787.1 hypothetical protein [Streptococcaceae bacterium]
MLEIVIIIYFIVMGVMWAFFTTEESTLKTIKRARWGNLKKLGDSYQSSTSEDEKKNLLSQAMSSVKNRGYFILVIAILLIIVDGARIYLASH